MEEKRLEHRRAYDNSGGEMRRAQEKRLEQRKVVESKEVRRMGEESSA